MMSQLVAIIAIAVIMAIFWQQRQQSEIAKRYIEHRCQQLNLQLISIARGSHKFTGLTASFGISTRYYFEFSANGLNLFEGYLVMKGNRIVQIYMPPYPI